MNKATSHKVKSRKYIQKCIGIAFLVIGLLMSIGGTYAWYTKQDNKINKFKIIAQQSQIQAEKTNIQIDEGLTLTAKYFDDNNTVTWSSSNESVVIIDPLTPNQSATATIKGVDPGQVTITATGLKGGDQATATIEITVPDPGDLEVIIDMASVEIEAIDNTIELKATGNATSYEWTSSDDNIIEVIPYASNAAAESIVTLKAKSQGVADITVTAKRGSKQKTATSKVSVGLGS